MRVFVTGATGFIGQALTRDLMAHGHEVVGLARSAAAAAKLSAMGAEVHRGSVRDLDSLRRGAAAAEGVVHLAFTFSPADLPLAKVVRAFLGGAPTGIIGRMMALIGSTDRAAIDALGGALDGSGRPLVAAFATMGVAGAPEVQAGRPATEVDAPDPQSPGFTRAANEAAIADLAKRGVRASLVRLSPSVHGDGDTGLVPQLIGAARKTGAASYVGDGANRWCGVHRDDAAALFRLALEMGAAGHAYHAVADEGVRFRAISEVIGRRLGLPVRSTTLAQAQRSLGFVAPFIAVDNPVSSDRTKQQLGWQPAGAPLLEDIDRKEYFAG